jgi:hypothetical protein
VLLCVATLRVAVLLLCCSFRVCCVLQCIRVIIRVALCCSVVPVLLRVALCIVSVCYSVLMYAFVLLMCCCVALCRCITMLLNVLC